MKRHVTRLRKALASLRTSASSRILLQGIWKPQKIANPAYFKDDTPLANIGKINAAAIEIWTMDSNYYFDDIVVANDPQVAEDFRLKTWTPKHEHEVSRSVVSATAIPQLLPAILHLRARATYHMAAE